MLLIICVFNLLLSCCEDEKSAPELNVIPSIIEFDNTESVKQISIESNTPWASSSNQGWCEASIHQQLEGNYTLDVKVSENTGDERVAYISFNNPEKTVIKTVKVVQKAKNE
jgi:hypothetical protein